MSLAEARIPGMVRSSRPKQTGKAFADLLEDIPDEDILDVEKEVDRMHFRRTVPGVIIQQDAEGARLASYMLKKGIDLEKEMGPGGRRITLSEFVVVAGLICHRGDQRVLEHQGQDHQTKGR